MRKVLLVDDEFLVCSFLKNLIVWEDYQFNIVGQANNGFQALELIQQLQPDLIFLDVSMPEMDGVELVRILHRQYPDIRVIMLSSYSDYDYVRETLRLGAVDYLLKHQITAESLIKLLSELKFEHQDDCNDVETEHPNSGYYFSVLRDSRTRSFFEQRTHMIPGALAHIQNILIVGAAIKVSLATDCGAEELAQRENFITALLSTCIQLCAQEYQVKLIYMGEHTLVLLFPARAGETEQEQRTRAERCMNVMHDAILKYHNTCIEWRISERCKEMEKAPEMYQRVLNQFAQQNSPAIPSKSYQLTIEQERQLIINVLGKDRIGVHRVLTSVFEPMIQHKIYGAELSLLYGDILMLAVKLYKENNQSFFASPNYGSFSNDPEKVYLYFEELFLSLINSMESVSQYSKAVTTIILFVTEHFREDISLYEIATHCGMNATYVSSIFKKETGISLVQFINRVRIYDAGKGMLMEGIPPIQVYERSGFHNYNNFFNLFKSVTGMNPSNFMSQATIDWVAKFSLLPSKR